MSGLFSREAGFLLKEGGKDHSGPSGRGGAFRYSGRGGRRGGRGRGHFNSRGGRNASSGGGYLDRDALEEDDGLGGETTSNSWSSGREQRYAPYKTSNRRPYRGRGSYQHNRGGGPGNSVFSRLGGLPSGNSRNNQDGYVGAPASSSWSKVTIHNGAQNNKEWLIKTLSSKVSGQLNPIQWHVLGDKAMFFVEDQRVAMQLKQVGKLSSSGGELSVVVKPSAPPTRGGGGGGQRFTDSRSVRGPPIQQQMSMEGMSDGLEQDNTEVILHCLSQRYDPSTKGLDLSDMFHDQVLQQHGIQGAMQRPAFANSVMSIVIDKCPDLVSLDLSSNRLRQLDTFSTAISMNLSLLQILNLSDNQLNHVEELNKVATSTVTNLTLEGNSLVNSCGDFSKYSSLMRAKFPNLQILDGQVLHSPVKFDLPTTSSSSLPDTKPSYLMNDEVQQFLKTFLEQYYNMYDDDHSRENLLNAYSSEAVFSLSVVTSERMKGPYLGDYFKCSRNIMKAFGAKRMSLLQRGKLDVVKALNDLPKTKHLASSFVVDVSRATPSFAVFSVWGLFAEVGSSSSSGHQAPVRSFSRMFVITSAQGSISIVNDQLTIRNSTLSQAQMVREALASQLQATSPIAQAVSSSLPNQGVSNTLSPTTMSLQQQQQLTSPSLEQQYQVKQLATETGMNVQFSEKCLSENFWQYDKAIHAFHCLKEKNALPPEAFVH
ncbi:nuclear RNA export factor 1-like isoform X2 [Dysidea avara]|uniref:nuclear RNA export factor 1-like isoform X2 n=1 Tax=Dysidea avara TaxID=196820 RepID=UPI00332B8704